jgi:hypothetical protein
MAAALHNAPADGEACMTISYRQGGRCFVAATVAIGLTVLEPDPGHVLAHSCTLPSNPVPRHIAVHFDGNSRNPWPEHPDVACWLSYDVNARDIWLVGRNHA